MSASIIFAKVLGPLFITVGLGLLVSKSFYLKVLTDLSKNAALIYFTGVLAFVVGLIIVMSYNVWLWDWSLAITLMGWGALIKGVLILIAPDAMIKVIEIYRNTPSLLSIHAVIAILLGVVLVRAGYLGCCVVPSLT